MSFVNIKELIYVLAFALPALYVVGELAAPIFKPREMMFLRIAWLIATLSAFLFTNFFFYAAIIAALCFVARASGRARPELFIILVFAVPAVNVEIGGFGVINTLMDMNNERLLAIVLLLPMLLLSPNKFSSRDISNCTLPDWLILAYAALMVALESRLGSVTNDMRAATLYSFDILLPYFVMSRRITTLASLQKVYLAFVVIAMILSLIAAFELVKKWHVYYAVFSAWGKIVFFGKEDFRGQASANGPIIFGFLVMVSMGCLLAIQHRIASRQFRMAAWGFLAIGLGGSLSRGPWIGTIVLMIAYVSTGPGVLAFFSRLGLASIVAMLLVFFTMPNIVKLSDILPFASIRSDTIDYRQQLLEQAMIVIARNPWLGSIDYREQPELLEMMQGQGIIDIVNHYVKVALDAGFVGLTLFVAFFLSVLASLRRILKSGGPRNGDVHLMARASRATVIAIMITIATVSSIDFIPYIYWSFTGLCVALVRIAQRERLTAIHAALASQMAVR